MSLAQIGQISIAVSDVDRSERFYEETLGLRKLYRYGDLTFFDCAGVRLMLSPPEGNATVMPAQSALVFSRTRPAARRRGNQAERRRDQPARRRSSRPMPDHDLWMAFFRDPDGHLIGLMMEAPKGYAPP